MAMEMEMVIVILNSDSISNSTRMRRMIGRATDLRFGMRRVQLLPPSLRPHRCCMCTLLCYSMVFLHEDAITVCIDPYNNIYNLLDQ